MNLVNNFNQFLTFGLIFLIAAIIVSLYILRLLKKNKIQQNIIDDNRENIKILVKENSTLNDLNSIQYRSVLEFKAHLSSLLAPFKQLLELKDIPEELTKEIQVSNLSSLGIQNLSTMVEDLYKVNYNFNKLYVSKCSVNKLENYVINYYNQLLNSNTIKLFVFKDKENKEVWIDFEKVGFILKNIISNSYRHINYGGTIWFTSKQTFIDNRKYCLITITDDGYMDENEKDYDSVTAAKNNLTDQFYQDNRFLGLKVIDYIINAHHGRFTIKTNSEGFKVYSLYIPEEKEIFEKSNSIEFVESSNIDIQVTENSNPPVNTDNSESIATKQADIDITKRKMLIIEDHKDIQLFLKIIFEKDYNLIFTDDGQSGYDAAVKEIPDIIISDIMMPVMNGFECCKKLKDNLNTCYIPIVMLTALVEEKDIVKGLELGVEDYIVKPFNPNVLKSKIRNIILKREKLRHSFASSPTIEVKTDDNKGQEEKNNPFIEKAVKIINENIGNPDFGVKMLSENLNMSQPTLYRKIKQCTNIATIELIVGVRLKTSAKLLKEGKYNVQEVAEMVGYNDIATFRKHFIDFYGVTPSAYNKKNVVT